MPPPDLLLLSPPVLAGAMGVNFAISESSCFVGLRLPYEPYGAARTSEPHWRLVKVLSFTKMGETCDEVEGGSHVLRLPPSAAESRIASYRLVASGVADQLLAAAATRGL